MPKERVIELLEQFYIAEVLKNGGLYNKTSNAPYIASVANWLTATEKKRGLILYGTVGSGKTTMLKALCNLIRVLKFSYKQLYDESLFDMGKSQREWCKEWANIYTPAFFVANDIVRNSEQLTKAISSRFVAIDDIGVEPVSKNDYGTISMPVTEIIYNCYDNSIPLIITTNLNDEQIKERYGLRVSDRLYEFCNRISYTIDSYRSK